MISSLINIVFYSLVIYFWLYTFEKISYQGDSNIYEYQTQWKMLLTVFMIILGFLTSSSEALYFLNDPINIINESHRPLMNLIKFLYQSLCFISLCFLIFSTLKIQINFSKLNKRDKLFYLFSLYFFFTINLCLLISHFNRKYFDLLSKRRKSSFGDYYQ